MKNDGWIAKSKPKNAGVAVLISKLLCKKKSKYQR